MSDAPTNKELMTLLRIAYLAIKSLKGEKMPLSQICNMLMREQLNMDKRHSSIKKMRSMKKRDGVVDILK